MDDEKLKTTFHVYKNSGSDPSIQTENKQQQKLDKTDETWKEQ